MPRLVRRLLGPALLVAMVYAASLRGRLATIVAAVVAVAIVALIFVVLPRLAHAAFERGDWGRAEIYYRLVRFFIAAPESRGAIDVSLAGCRLARHDWVGALTELDDVTPDALPPPARAAWFNNRAYALARSGTSPSEALRAIEEAVRLRPDVAGFRHTRGVVLLALDRTDDAIAELDAVWHELGGDGAPALLEAERCFDLGTAWAKKGEKEYAKDYFLRAFQIAPRSDWGTRAEAALQRA